MHAHAYMATRFMDMQHDYSQTTAWKLATCSHKLQITILHVSNRNASRETVQLTKDGSNLEGKTVHVCITRTLALSSMSWLESSCWKSVRKKKNCDWQRAPIGSITIDQLAQPHFLRLETGASPDQAAS